MEYKKWHHIRFHDYCGFEYDLNGIKIRIQLADIIQSGNSDQLEYIQQQNHSFIVALTACFIISIHVPVISVMYL